MENNKLQLIINESGLSPDQSKPLLDSFGGFFVKAHKLVTKSKVIKVTREDQVEEMQQAREIRIELKNLRNEADKVRVSLKEGYLRGGNAVQAIFNDIKDIIKPEEDRLLEQEKFLERIEAERKNKVEVERVSQLLKYVEEAEGYSLHPDQMSEETFNKLLENSRLAFEARKKAEEDAEKERLVQIEAEKKEQERIRKENEKLKIEAEKRERELIKERATQQKKLEAERKARFEAEEKIRKEKEAKEAEEKLKQDKLLAEQRANEEAERKALLAPDKEKLLEFAKQIQGVTAPAVKSKEADLILEKAMQTVSEAVEILQEGAKKL